METVGFDEHGNPDVYERTVEPEEWIADLLRRDLTNDRSTFTRADVTQAVASRQGAGASIETIERLADAVIASAHVHTGPQRQRSSTLDEPPARRHRAAVRRRHSNAPRQTVFHPLRSHRPELIGRHSATTRRPLSIRSVGARRRSASSSVLPVPARPSPSMRLRQRSALRESTSAASLRQRARRSS